MFEPELYRLRGELLLDADRLQGDAAREVIRKGAGEARRQGATLLELRAAHSLAASLAGEGRIPEARAVLEPAVASVSEGLDTRDVVEATALDRQSASDDDGPTGPPTLSQSGGKPVTISFRLLLTC